MSYRLKTKSMNRKLKIYSCSKGNMTRNSWKLTNLEKLYQKVELMTKYDSLTSKQKWALKSLASQWVLQRSQRTQIIKRVHFLKKKALYLALKRILSDKLGKKSWTNRTNIIKEEFIRAQVWILWEPKDQRS